MFVTLPFISMNHLQHVQNILHLVIINPAAQSIWFLSENLHYIQPPLLRQANSLVEVVLLFDLNQYFQWSSNQNNLAFPKINISNPMLCAALLNITDVFLYLTIGLLMR